VLLACRVEATLYFVLAYMNVDILPSCSIYTVVVLVGSVQKWMEHDIDIFCDVQDQDLH
jgi:hypothetical protein